MNVRIGKSKIVHNAKDPDFTFLSGEIYLPCIGALYSPYQYTIVYSPVTCKACLKKLEVKHD